MVKYRFWNPKNQQKFSIKKCCIRRCGHDHFIEEIGRGMTNQRTNRGWSRRCSSTSPPTLPPKFYDHTVICFQMPCPFELETDFVHNAGETSRNSSGHRISADCFRTIVLRNVCLHDFAQHGAVFGHPPVRRTTWFPCWTTLGATFAHRKFIPG